jgi:type II secretory pathway component GspD/PulD (secretin)
MKNIVKSYGWIPWVLPLILWLSTSTCLAETVVIPMQYRTAEEALPMVKDLLSSGGRAAADSRTNSLLVVDDSDSIKRVREFLAGFDQLGKQARVRVRFQERGSSADRDVAARARVSGGDWRVSAGGRRRTDGVDVRLQDRSVTERGASEYFIAVVSGAPAYIMVGQDILFTERWLDLTRRYARVSEAVSIQRIETGMEVRPTLLKDHADIEIIPRISGIGTERGVIRFTEAATRLLAPYGQWVTIGEASQQSNEVMQEILAWGRGERRSVTSISLLVQSSD